MSVYKGQEKVLNSITAVEEARVKEIVGNEMTTKGVCTTKVADVPSTNIDLSTISTEFTSGKLFFEVVNGICYVGLHNVVFANTSSGNLTINIDNLPKSKVRNWYPILNLATLKGTIVSAPQHINGLEFYTDREVGSAYYGSFSYPVAE